MPEAGHRLALPRRNRTAIWTARAAHRWRQAGRGELAGTCCGTIERPCVRLFDALIVLSAPLLRAVTGCLGVAPTQGWCARHHSALAPCGVVNAHQCTSQHQLEPRRLAHDPVPPGMPDLALLDDRPQRQECGSGTRTARRYTGGSADQTRLVRAAPGTGRARHWLDLDVRGPARTGSSSAHSGTHSLRSFPHWPLMRRR